MSSTGDKLKSYNKIIFYQGKTQESNLKSFGQKEMTVLLIQVARIKILRNSLQCLIVTIYEGVTPTNYTSKTEKHLIAFLFTRMTCYFNRPIEPRFFIYSFINFHSLLQNSEFV